MRLRSQLCSKKELDIVIFGASGFTGRLLVKEMAKQSKMNQLRWAVAGRSHTKLKNVLQNTSMTYGLNLQDITTIEADVADSEALKRMCHRARLVVNCVGPYRFYGEQVVKAALEAQTHYLDVSGEPQFLETVQFKYDDEARKKEVYIVGSCGFDSIPCDLGVQFLKNNFNGTVNSVETFLRVTCPKGAKGNYATWVSLIHGYAHRKELYKLREQLYKKLFNSLSYPPTKYRMQRKTFFYDNYIHRWNFPFPGSDRSVVRRSQMYHYRYNDERPAQIETYFVANNIKAIFGLVLMQVTFAFLSLFKFGQKLLEDYPKIFSWGLFDRSEPSLDQLVDNTFELILKGSGWNENYRAGEEPKSAPGKTVIARVSGGDPAYLSTAIITIQAAITILEESNKLPRAGVLTPAVAFAGTNLIERLSQNHIKFEVRRE